MGYSLDNMADFENYVISRILGVFSNGFVAHNNSNVLVEWFFASFSHFKFLSQTDHLAKLIAFPWAIAFARRSTFKVVSFLD